MEPEVVADNNVSNKTCEICSRTFARSEHLVRHRRTHTNERPFPCPHCDRNFPRADVRTKHMKRSHGPAASPLDQPSSPTTARRSAGQERSKLACDECRRRKLRCDNSHPCKSCRTRRLECHVSKSSKPPGRPRHDRSETPDDQVPQPRLDSAFEITAEPMSWSLEPLEPANLSVSLPADAQENNASTGLTTAIPPSMLRHTEVLAHMQQAPSQDPLIGISMGEGPNEPSPLEVSAAVALDSTWSAVGVMDDSWQLPPLGVDGWLEAFDEIPSNDDNWVHEFMITNTEHNPSRMDAAVSMMRDYFQTRSRASSPTRGGARELWYSAPPALHLYDEDVINVLLNLARSHLSGTFRLFATFKVTDVTREELCLAMAAVGGLFCTVPGSTKVAKKLYNDARRLLLETAFAGTLSYDLSLSAAKTFILLEVYGLCSGDKRSYEFVEAFHSNTLEAITSSCKRASSHESNSGRMQDQELLFEALQVLESYRVLLLLRPPSFTSIYQTSIQLTTCNASKYLSVGTPLISGDESDEGAGSLQSLAAISAYSWMSGPQGPEMTPNQGLWQREFVELALDRWVKDTTMGVGPRDSAELSKILLYHLTHIKLRSNLRALQNSAQNFARTIQDPNRGETTRAICAWVTSTHHQIANWHAKAILRLVKESLASSRRSKMRSNGPQLLEAPHLPYCIYFAALIDWYGALVRAKEHSGGDGVIDSASQLLFSLKVRVSRQLGQALCELLSDAK